MNRNLNVALVLLVLVVGCSKQPASTSPRWTTLEFHRAEQSEANTSSLRIEETVKQEGKETRVEEPSGNITLIVDGMRYDFPRGGGGGTVRKLPVEHKAHYNFIAQLSAEVAEIEGKWKREGEEILNGERCVRYSQTGRKNGETFEHHALLAAADGTPRRIERRWVKALRYVHEYSEVKANASLPASTFVVPSGIKLFHVELK